MRPRNWGVKTGDKRIASPVSTGGAGSDYENLVGAFYLSGLLLGSTPLGLPAGVTREVRFQRSYQGQPLDDLIIVSDLPAGESKLSLQVKRKLEFGSKNALFDEVISACWETHKSPEFNPELDRFGFVANILPAVAREQYQSVLSWARTSANAKDFVVRIQTEGLSNEPMRRFERLMRDKLDKFSNVSIDDEGVWNFLRSLVILELDFQRADSKDRNSVIALLQNALPPETRDRAADLFERLNSYSAGAHGTAGCFDLRTLTQTLQVDGFILLPPVDCRDDLQRLRDHALFILNEIKTDVGGLQINRDALVDQAFATLRQAPLLELVGLPGVGKSAILKAMAERTHAHGPILVLTGDRIQGRGWDEFAQHLHLTQPLDKLLLAISANLTPCIFIDGIDRISDPGGHKVIGDLLNCVKQLVDNQAGHIRWKVIISARAENLSELYRWLDWQDLGRPELQEVPELTDGEVNLAVEHLPHLQAVIRSGKQVLPVMRNLYMLSLIERRRERIATDNLSEVATEVWVGDTWWEGLVGTGQGGLGRQQTLLRLGENAASRPSSGLSAVNEDPQILETLQSDRILVRDGNRLFYRFEHDLLEDWVLWRVLDHHRDELAAYLNQIGQPFGLSRSLQLMALALLENHPTADGWRQILSQIEGANQLMPRWRQAILSAPLISPRAPELLNKIEPHLLAEDGRLLNELMLAMRTVEVYPDFSLLPAAAMVEQDINSILSLLYYSPIPRWQTWQPFLAWLVERMEVLPSAVRPELIRLMEIWQMKTPARSVLRREIGRQALDWLLEIEHWQSNDEE